MRGGPVGGRVCASIAFRYIRALLEQHALGQQVGWDLPALHELLFDRGGLAAANGQGRCGEVVDLARLLVDCIWRVAGGRQPVEAEHDEPVVLALPGGDRAVAGRVLFIEYGPYGLLERQHERQVLMAARRLMPATRTRPAQTAAVWSPVAASVALPAVSFWAFAVAF